MEKSEIQIESFEDLVAMAQQLYPRLDKWVIEGYVKLYFDGLLSEKGEVLKEETNE